MQYTFNAHGHPNILATHKTTLEFTRDSELSLKGDCIVGVRADFELNKIKKIINKSKNNKIKILIETENKKINGIIEAELNPNFNDNNEIVIRKTDFASERTLAYRSNKAAFALKMALIDFLKEKRNKITVILKSS